MSDFRTMAAIAFAGWLIAIASIGLAAWIADPGAAHMGERMAGEDQDRTREKLRDMGRPGNWFACAEPPVAIWASDDGEWVRGTYRRAGDVEFIRADIAALASKRAARIARDEARAETAHIQSGSAGDELTAADVDYRAGEDHGAAGRAIEGGSIWYQRGHAMGSARRAWALDERNALVEDEWKRGEADGSALRTPQPPHSDWYWRGWDAGCSQEYFARSLDREAARNALRWREQQQSIEWDPIEQPEDEPIRAESLAGVGGGSRSTEGT